MTSNIRVSCTAHSFWQNRQGRADPSIPSWLPRSVIQEGWLKASLVCYQVSYYQVLLSLQRHWEPGGCWTWENTVDGLHAWPGVGWLISKHFAPRTDGWVVPALQVHLSHHGWSSWGYRQRQHQSRNKDLISLDFKSMRASLTLDIQYWSRLCDFIFFGCLYLS